MSERHQIERKLFSTASELDEAIAWARKAKGSWKQIDVDVLHIANMALDGSGFELVRKAKDG